MNEHSLDAVLESLDRSTDILRGIANRRDVPKNDRRNLLSFAKKIDATFQDCHDGKITLSSAILLRQCARLMVESALLKLSKQRLGVDVDLGNTEKILNAMAAHVRTGRKIRRSDLVGSSIAP